jgi:hypothetical protein
MLGRVVGLELGLGHLGRPHPDHRGVDWKAFAQRPVGEGAYNLEEAVNCVGSQVPVDQAAKQALDLTGRKLSSVAGPPSRSR